MREAGVTPEQFHVDGHESHPMAVQHAMTRREVHGLHEYTELTYSNCATKEWVDDVARRGKAYNFAWSTNTEAGEATNRMLEVITRCSERDVMVAGLYGFQFNTMTATRITEGCPWGTIVFVYANAKRNRNQQKWTLDQPAHHRACAEQTQDECFREGKRARTPTDFYGRKSEQ